MSIRFFFLAWSLMAGSNALAHEFSGAHGTLLLDWKAPGISRVLSSGYGDSFGMEAWARKGLAMPVEIAGRECIKGTYFLFDVDDEFMFDTDEVVDIEFLFARRQSAGFNISYDQNVIPENVRAIIFPASEERWYSHLIRLERARFANRGESGTDFVITAPDGTWLGDPRAEHKIVLCDLKITRSHKTVLPKKFGKLQLTVVDGEQLSPVRIGLYDEADRMPLPTDNALTIRNYDDRTKQIFLRKTHPTVPPWPHDNRFFFYIDGRYEADLPIGNYELVITKGPEYRRELISIQILEGETSALEVALSRWTDMPALGWYSGDDHVHMTRTPADNEPISLIMRAEDVHITNLLQMGNPYDTNFNQYAFGRNGRYQKGKHTLVSGVEDPRTAVRGHTISMNIKEVFRPLDRYLRYDQIFAEYRKQGGLSGFAHVAGRLFNVERGLAIDVPLGAVDFVEILQDGVLETGLWYDFLNLGFKLIPTAGSDFPYLSAPGGERNYVYVGSDYTVDGYYAALQQHRTFVTNGPILELSVNGEPMGSDMLVSSGDQLAVVAEASLNPDIEELDRLELIVHGDVVASVNLAAKDNSLTLRHTIRADDGFWLAIRAYGIDQAVAHSAPVYINTGSGFENSTLVSELARRMLGYLDDVAVAQPDVTEELEAWSVGENLASMFVQQRLHILERAEKARLVYARMLDRL